MTGSITTATEAQSILLIEDNPDHARAIEIMVTRSDLATFDFSRTASLAEALVSLRREQPRLILLDLHLPDGQGLSLLHLVRTAAPLAPIVVLTALDDDQLATEALKSGAQDYLVKGTYNTAALNRTIRHAIARHELLTDLERARSREAKRATHDELTGLPNRLLFFDRIGHALERSFRTSSRFAVVYIDLNGFKTVNDSFGHAAGDEILREVARRLKSHVRASDTVARLGGDEFTILYETFPDRRTAEALVRGLHEIFEDPIVVDEREHAISVSAGLAVYPEDGQDAETLLRVADGVMYAAKSAGHAGRGS